MFWPTFYSSAVPGNLRSVPLSMDDVFLTVANGRIGDARTRANEIDRFARKCQDPVMGSGETKQEGCRRNLFKLCNV
jgi:hypothetical protein